MSGKAGRCWGEARGTETKLPEDRSVPHHQGISYCWNNSLYAVIKHRGMAGTGRSARCLPAVCLVFARAVKSLGFTSNTLFQPPPSRREKTHLFAGANVLFLLPAHSHRRPTRTAASSHVSFTFIDDASFVARETKQHIEFGTTANQFSTPP